MPRPSAPVSALAVVLLGLLLAAPPAAHAAQYSPEGTPPVEEAFAPEGVTFEPLGFGTAQELPGAPADIALLRVTFEPDAGFPIEAGDPSVALGYVESGALTVRVEAPVRVTRAATPGAVEEGAIPEPEEVAAGTEFELEAGDSYVFPPNAAGELRNDGQERAVLLAAIVEPTEGEAATPAAAGTPAAGAQEGDGPHPAHIHSGTCDELGDVVHPLADVADPTGEAMGAAGGHPVKLSEGTQLDVPLEELLDGDHAINVHLSADEIGTYIACGNIGGVVHERENGEGMELTIALAELNGSGHVGIAWLGDDGEGGTNVHVSLIEPDEMR